MRSKTSPDFLITMKINSTDEYPGGLTTQDFMLTSRLMADAGVDAIEVSANGTSRTGIRAGQNEAISVLPLWLWLPTSIRPSCWWAVCVPWRKLISISTKHGLNTSVSLVPLSVSRTSFVAGRRATPPRLSACRATPATTHPVTSAFST